MRAAAAAALALLMVAPALAADTGGGQWEILGEDGRVWVPDDPPAAAYLPPPDLGSYHNYDEMTAALQALAAARPDVVTLASLGRSVEGRDLWAVTLRAGPADARPAVLFDGAHHGDEVIASEILVRYAQDLADGYPSDARSRAILENVTVVVVPMVNPDGVSRAHLAANYADARKNARSVDLNRNYAGHWGGPGSSGSPSDATYRGPSPASEPETQAMTALLASRDWTFYSSLHSGAEMILWPWGWTTAPPPESALYTQLGNELTAITGAPNGQVSRILYSVSGDSMDAAYGGPLPAWRPVATSPETYEGSGNAFDWWYLFNPPDADITTVYARWKGFLDHLATQAPAYAPARLAGPGSIVAGGEPFDVSATLTPSAKRPVLSASLRVDAPSFLGVTTTNPISLGNVAAPTTGAWTLAPSSGGVGELRVVATSGVAGNITATASVQVVAPSITVALAKTRAGSGDVVNATVTMVADDALAGVASLRVAGATTATRNVTLDAGASLAWTVSVPVGDAPAGPLLVEAVLAYAEGSVRASATLTVERADLDVARAYPGEAPVGQSFLMTVVVRNVGNLAARNVTLTELVPTGYALAPRETGPPVPPDPLARPAPKRVEASDDGRVALSWEVLGILPGGQFAYQVRLVPVEPGDHNLETAMSYRTQYADRAYAHAERETDPQAATLPV